MRKGARVPALLELDPKQGDDRPELGAGPSAPRSRGRRSRDPRRRIELRRQIARMERELGELFATTFPRRGIDWSVGAAGGPRVLGIAELERIRDALADRLAEARAEIARRADEEQANRELVERMIADPAEYRWVRVRNEDVGEPRLQALALAPALGDHRDVPRLVAGQALVGLSLSHRVAPPAPPAPRSADRWLLEVARKRRKRRPPPAAGRPRRRAASRPSRPRAASRPGAGAADDEPPPAPGATFRWSSSACSPGSIMLILGFFVVERRSRGPILIAAGLALGSIGGLELSIREHFAGYRSHTLILAGVPALIVLGLLFYLGPDGLPPLARAAIADRGLRGRPRCC